MRNSYYVISIFFMFLWAIFLAHVSPFSYFDLFLIVSLLIYLDTKDIRIFSIWIVLVGLVLDVLLLQPVGVSTFVSTVALSAFLVVDRSLKLISNNRYLLSVFIFITIAQFVKFVSFRIVNEDVLSVPFLVTQYVLTVLLTGVVSAVFLQNRASQIIRV